MKKGQKKQGAGADLRSPAQSRLIGKGEGQPATAEDRSAAEMQRLVQELQDNRIELERQNEELRRARGEAEAERERYLTLYNFAPVGYLTLDNQGIIREANLPGARLLGVARSQLPNRSFGSFVSETDISFFNTFLEKVFADRVKQSGLLALAREGSPPLHVRIEAVVAGNGRECRVALMDITDRKKAENEAQKLRDELELRVAERTAQLEAAKKELESFCYSVSHDLQTPLRAIDGYSRMILRQAGNQFDQDTRGKFEIIRSSIQKMGQLIEELLAFSRLGRKTFSVVAVNMDAIVREAWEELRAIQPEKTMVLKNSGLPPTMGDRGLISQVVGNILSNAVKFAGTRKEILVEVSGYAAGNENVYAIKDNGIGFDMAYYNKLFGMFQRLHRVEEYEGTGVGLAIAHRIILRHGGRIWAESKIDEGACFYFTLPKA